MSILSFNSDSDQPALTKFFVDELSDVLNAEKQLTKALPQLEMAATSPDLAKAFAEHLKVTQNQIARLERVFKIIGMSPKDKKCKGMEGLIAEGQAVIKDTEDGSATRDVGLIVAAQKVEHYEIAAYGSLRQLAKMTEKAEIAQLLEETLQEEKETDMLLSNLAESFINEDAKQVDG
ncbi:ferritin-like domain-containing protein [Fulvivirgaceae bacterium PWU5]|uniref:Ferritin-like domain-containing protein n=1 Tax=Dawidia cretensis TaxID=2782350 RepID=A0AAP2E347_9BACT|nr:ferritin-like domain-containing protein [Dawidia cretensis]MBT1712176.1 ferritin-like domain-containing protein [Dawidia cretensis]